MRAMRAEGFRGYQDLKLVDIPKPHVSDGRVLVKINAAGVTPLEHTILSGGYPRAKAPLVLGSEGAGVVEDANSSDFSPGARVMFTGLYGVSEDGAYSEYLASRRKPGILVSLDFEFVEDEAGRAVFAGTPGEHAYNPIGAVHGGYAATLLDSVCGCAVHSRLTASQAYTTLELKVAYHKRITKDTGLLRAERNLLSFGQRVAFAEAKLTDVQGKLYASAPSTLLIFER